MIGIEGDGSGADIDGDITQTVLGITETAHARTDWIASVTGRFGWAWERWLIYAKGGAAWAGIPQTYLYLMNTSTPAKRDTRGGEQDNGEKAE